MIINVNNDEMLGRTVEKELYFELYNRLKEKDKKIERLKEINKELGRDYSSANNGYLRLHSIIKEAINYIDDNTYYKDHKGHINIDDLYLILQKGSESNE